MGLGQRRAGRVQLGASGVDLRLGNDERREEPHHIVARLHREQALLT